MGEFDASCLQDLLKPYYDRLFPYELMFKWLSYGSEDLFSRREFSFTLMGDVYLRYLSFANQEEFAKELKRRNPEKIDIGAVYTQKPKMRESSMGFQPVEKEFVIDIDLTDYDDVRSCCSGAKVCEKCWKYLALAVKILDVALKEDFGFKHLLWVYSGRRGVHCWVCDSTARSMDSNGRGAVIEYLSLIKGGESKSKKISLPNDNIHPFIARSVSKIAAVFDDICGKDQEVFEMEKNFELLPDDIKKATRSSTNRLRDIIDYIMRNKKDKKSWKHLIEELQLQFCYPRLDVNVSKGLNHLLKSPFCIHPKTGQVCVPFNPENVDTFNTKDVPQITQLLDEIAKHDKDKGNDSQKMDDWEKTSISQYMNIFSKFIKDLQREQLKQNGEQGDIM